MLFFTVGQYTCRSHLSVNFKYGSVIPLTGLTPTCVCLFQEGHRFTKPYVVVIVLWSMV